MYINIVINYLRNFITHLKYYKKNEFTIGLNSNKKITLK